mmetsp:Transcript_8908/g.21479  ORF Transcript_8908/g.21479 Transcript_8908/m.21479 type:complete len:253 (+) Transcript_8908:58-816(+)
MKGLSGKVAIVTASTAGIGLAIARRLSIEGAHVVISSRKQVNVDKAIEQLREEGLRVEGRLCHVGDQQQRKGLISSTVQKYGRLDIVVSNAAVNPSVGLIAEQTDEVIDKIFDVNVKSAIQLVREAIPYLTAGGSFVFVSSQMALQPSPPLGVYGVSKTALLGLTKALALELGPNGIRVNSVLPGVVPTHFASAIMESGTGEAMRAATPLGRLGTPEDIASAVAFLASEDAGFITGENLLVNGGCTMLCSRL